MLPQATHASVTTSHFHSPKSAVATHSGACAVTSAWNAFICSLCSPPHLHLPSLNPEDAGHKKADTELTDTRGAGVISFTFSLE